MLPPRHYERLAKLLLRLLGETLNPAVASSAASSLGITYGEETAAILAAECGQSQQRLSPQAVVGWMDDAGYSVALSEGDDGAIVLQVQNCVYRELSQKYSHIVCSFDCGMVCGMLGADPAKHTQTQSLSAGDEFCRHEFRL